MQGALRVRAVLAVGVAACSALVAGVGVDGASAVLVDSGPPQLTYTPSSSWWSTNGRVADMKVIGGRVYLAGGFDYLGPTTGYGVRVDPSTGAKAPGPLVDGIVRAAVPDGQGGWYLGGSFRKVGGKGRVSLAQVSASGTVTGWNVKTDGVVNAIAVTSSGVVVGGSFGTVNGVATPNLAKVDRVTGALATWKPSPNQAVRALAVQGSSVYVGGDFTVLNGVSRSRLARVSLSTGTTETAFTGTAASTVRTLALAPGGSVLYAGGDFTTAAGAGSTVSRSRLAAFSTSNGAVTAFAPSANASVQALTVDSVGRVYAGGLFTSISTVARGYLAQLTPTGSLGTLNTGLSGCHVRHTTKYAHGLPPCTPEVAALSITGNTLFVGGRFGASGTAQRHDAAAFALDTGMLTSWNPVPGDRPLTVASTASGVFLGGDFTSVGGLVRRGLAALDAVTGVGVPAFRADANEYVETLAASTDGSRLFLGGNFTVVQGQPRPYFAALDTATGLVVSAVRPAFNRGILALAYSSGAVYAGGQFTTVNGLARGHAAKLDATTGTLSTTWVANTTGPTGTLRQNGMVMGVAVPPDGSKVFLAGPFTAVNGTSVAGGLAVVSGLSGQLGPRQLGGVNGCGGGVGPWINRLYLSDDGERLYGGDICPDDVYQWDAVNLSSASNPTGLRWRTSCNGGMQGRLEVNGHFYYGSHGGDQGAGGHCLDRPGGTWVEQQRYYVFNASNGYLYPDRPEFDTPMGVWSFAATDAGLLVGGDFTSAGTARNVAQGVAFFPGRP